MAVLFDDPFLPRLFSDLLDLPENKDRVLVLEGTTDEAYFREAARHYDMEKRLKPVHIIPAEGAKKAARTGRKAAKGLSEAMKEANDRLRTKSGKLRKGVKQGDVTRLAHKIRRKKYA